MTSIEPSKNALFYGDNLTILRDYIASDSIDLIYLDPPFNSNRSYNVLFKNESGVEAQSQISAFDDTWHWGKSAEDTFYELITGGNQEIAGMVNSMREFIGTNQMMAYLVMMTARLVELHRVLKPTGSLYLHCDPTASHYLKVILDSIFGVENYRNEIVWKRATAHSDAKTKFADVADILLYYVKSKAAAFKPQYGLHDPDYIEKFYRYDDHDGRGLYTLDNMASPNPRTNLMYEWMGFPFPEKGWRYQKSTMATLHEEGRVWYPKNSDGSFDFSRRPRLKRYLKEQEGSIITNIWTDVQSLQSFAAERLGYPTQKPLALLDRIINASSNPGDVVLDPFSGCGTAIASAQKNNRRWIGIDVSHLAIAMHKSRLKDMFGLEPKKDYNVIGEPNDLASAIQLAHDDRYQFQWWALSLVQARPVGGTDEGKTGKKGKDKGIDGIIPFIDGKDKSYKRVIVQVKSGGVKSGDIRDLRGVMEREKDAEIGVFITLEPPSKDMVIEAVSSGHYDSFHWHKQYPRIQILTIKGLLHGEVVQMPPSYGPFKKAEFTEKSGAEQLGLNF